MLMVERERDPGVPEIRDDGQRVVEPVVAEAVGAVAEPEVAHVAERRLVSCRARGAAAATAMPVSGAPARAVSAPCRVGRLTMPAPTEARMFSADGLSIARSWGS